MKFNFRLQRLLDLREAAEKHQASELGRAANAEQTLRQASELSADQLESVQSQVSDSTTGGIAAGLFHAYGLAMEAASVQHEQDEAALREAEVQRLAEEERFTEARMARRAVERLRERKSDEWTVEHNREEQKDQDEIAQRQTRRGDQRS